MPNSRFIWAAGLLLLPSLLLADEWANMATISAEPTPGYVCSGNADGKNITCAGPRPYVDTAGFIGIGTSIPERALHIVGTGDVNDDFVIESNNNSTSSGGIIVFYFSRGTNSAKMPPQANDYLGGVSGRGWNGTAYYRGGEILFRSESNWATEQTGYISLFTALAGANAERMRITGAGLVGIGTTTPATKLDVNGAIKVAGNSETCTITGDIGKIRYNSTTGRFQICRP